MRGFSLSLQLNRTAITKSNDDNTNLQFCFYIPVIYLMNHPLARRYIQSCYFIYCYSLTKLESHIAVFDFFHVFQREKGALYYELANSIKSQQFQLPLRSIIDDMYYM